VWGYAVLRCPACGVEVGPDFAFCHICGAPLRGASSWGPPYPPSSSPSRVWGARTRRGLALILVSLLLLWIPNVTIFGAVLLSVGSILIFVDRHPFPSPHRRAVVFAYVLFWLAAAAYVVAFLALVSTAYSEFLNRGRLDDLRPITVLFIGLSTLPTELLVTAIALQVRNLLPPSARRQVPWAAVALGGLVLLATLIAFWDVAPGLGSEFIRTSSVLGILNRIAIARIVEGPGFAWFAYLYYRAYRTVVPKAASAGEPIPSIPAP